MKSVIDRYNELDAAATQQWREKRDVAEIEERKATEFILSSLQRAGVATSNVSTNGYWFNFEFKGQAVHFVSQIGRICGDFHRVSANDEEAEFLQSISSKICIYPELKDAIESEFTYRSFTFDGPITMTLSKLLEILVAP